MFRRSLTAFVLAAGSLLGCGGGDGSGGGGATGDELPPESAVQAIKVAEFPGYTEGIAFDDRGSAFVSILGHDAIYEMPPGGAPVPWVHVTQPNGHKILASGQHVVAVKAAVDGVAPAGHPVVTLAPGPDDPPLFDPNDVAVDGHGGFYFTDPGTAKTNPALRIGKVYYVNGAGVTNVAAIDFGYCNGIAVRPDGRALLVDDSITSEVIAFDIVAPGQLTHRRTIAMLTRAPVHVTGTSLLDGMTFDAAGRLYVAHYGSGVVDVLDPNGSVLRSYDVGITASNVAFGGDGLGQLFVTGSPLSDDGTGVLYELPLGIVGRGGSALPAP